MASMDQCLTALRGILGDLAANPAAAGLDRSLSCRLTDLEQVVVGRLSSGAVRDLEVVPDGPDVARADIRLTMTSDDLVALTGGRAVLRLGVGDGPGQARGRAARPAAAAQAALTPGSRLPARPAPTPAARRRPAAPPRRLRGRHRSSG